MTAKVFVVLAERAEPVQVGGNFYAMDDAASDIRGGDFWSEMRKLFPDGGVTLKEVRIVLDRARPVVWEG